jgi:enoyl-CoA hydratase
LRAGCSRDDAPDAHAFIDKATRAGVKAATEQRDALFADYSMAGTDRRPDTNQLITP